MLLIEIEAFLLGMAERIATPQPGVDERVAKTWTQEFVWNWLAMHADPAWPMGPEADMGLSIFNNPETADRSLRPDWVWSGKGNGGPEYEGGANPAYQLSAKDRTYPQFWRIPESDQVPSECIRRILLQAQEEELSRWQDMLKFREMEYLFRAKGADEGEPDREPSFYPFFLARGNLMRSEDPPIIYACADPAQSRVYFSSRTLLLSHTSLTNPLSDTIFFLHDRLIEEWSSHRDGPSSELDYWNHFLNLPQRLSYEPQEPLFPSTYFYVYNVGDYPLLVRSKAGFHMHVVVAMYELVQVPELLILPSVAQDIEMRMEAEHDWNGTCKDTLLLTPVTEAGLMPFMQAEVPVIWPDFHWIAERYAKIDHAWWPYDQRAMSELPSLFGRDWPWQ